MPTDPRTNSFRAHSALAHGATVKVGPPFEGGGQGVIHNARINDLRLAIKTGASAREIAIHQLLTGSSTNRFNHHIITLIGHPVIQEQTCLLMSELPNSLAAYFPAFHAYIRLHPHCSKMSRLIYRILSQGLCALSHCHEYNVIHCDIKGANFLCDFLLNIFLCDFGGAEIHSSQLAEYNGLDTVGTNGDYLLDISSKKWSSKSDVFVFANMLLRLQGRDTQNPCYSTPAQIIYAKQKIADASLLFSQSVLEAIIILMLAPHDERPTATQLLAIVEHFRVDVQMQNERDPIDPLIMQIIQSQPHLAESAFIPGTLAKLQEDSGSYGSGAVSAAASPNGSPYASFHGGLIPLYKKPV